MADKLPVSRPAVSQHLKILKDAGLVVDRQAGTRRVYQVDPRGVAPEGARRTRVDFEHRDLENHGPAAEAMRTAMEPGWSADLESYAKIAAAR